MGTTAQKLQKLVDNKQLIVDSVNAKAGTAFTINSKPSDIANAISDITSGGGIPEGYIKPSGNKEITENGDYDITSFASVSVNVPTTGESAGGTAVPNSGYVEKVYVNTSMSVEEVNSLIDSVVYEVNEGGYTMFAYPVLVNSDSSTSILFMIMNNVYGIVLTVNGTEYDIYQNGWKLDNMPIDYENGILLECDTLTEFMGMSVGTRNDKLTSLFSTTPFGGSSCEPTGLPLEVDSLPIKKGTAVPNSGTIDKIYFNTALSNEEVNSMLDILSYVDVSGVPTYFITCPDTAIPLLACSKFYDSDLEEYGYAIGLLGFNSEITYIYTYNTFDYSTDTYFENGFKLSEIDYNKNLVDGMNIVGMLVGLENDKIANLVSTTPFESDGVEGAIYKLTKQFAYLYLNDGSTLMNYTEILANQGMAFNVYFVDSQPVAEKMETTNMDVGLFNIYWVESENDGYLLMDGSLLKYSETLGTEIPINGVVSSTNEMTNTGGYLLKYNKTLYYKYVDNKFKEIAIKDSSIDSNIQPENIANGVTILGVTGTAYTLKDMAYRQPDGEINLDLILGEDIDSVRDGLFANTGITKVTGNYIKWVKYASFANCYSLEEVDFPILTSLERYAFEGCSSLKKITLPNTLSQINVSSFAGCTSLEEIVIPAGSIYGEAFNGCWNLKTIDITYNDNGLVAFYQDALVNCHSIKTIIIRNTYGVTTIYGGFLNSAYPFTGIVSEQYNPTGKKFGYIYVPRALVDAYKTNTNWSTYASQIRALEDYTIDGTITGDLDETKI